MKAAPWLLSSYNEQQELISALPKVTIHFTSYSDRLSAASQDLATDADIMALVESCGGSVNQYQGANPTRVLAADKPSLSAYRNNFTFMGQSGFDDTALMQLTTLLKQRPDIFVVCFNANGTPITNVGLRSLKGIPMAQLSITDTDVIGDSMATELSDFSISEWSAIPGMTEAGYLDFLKDARLARLQMDARLLTDPVIHA